MALSLIILAEGPGADLVAHLGPAAPILYARMLGDTVRVARQIFGSRVTVRYNPDAPAAILAGLPLATEVVTAPTVSEADVSEALAQGMAEGHAAIVVGGDLPHLPPWRLRDAATHLNTRADVVVGPSDRGSWYMLGLRAAAAPLLGALPAPGASPEALVAAAGRAHVVHLLPLWFGVQTVADLANLADVLRTMPPEVAAATRSILEVGLASRAVGG